MKKQKRKRKQKGFSTIQVLAAIAIAGAVSVGAVAVLAPTFSGVILNQAYEELNMLTAAVRDVREYNGDFADMTNFAWLVNNGYVQSDRYTTGVNQNAYGNTITAAPATGNQDGTLTYVADTAAQCLGLADRLSQTQGIVSTACATVTLTVTVD